MYETGWKGQKGKGLCSPPKSALRAADRDAYTGCGSTACNCLPKGKRASIYVRSTFLAILPPCHLGLTQLGPFSYPCVAKPPANLCIAEPVRTDEKQLKRGLLTTVSSTHAHLAQLQKTCLDSGLHMAHKGIAEVGPARRFIPPCGQHAE
jgi:hypothetical protein